MFQQVLHFGIAVRAGQQGQRGIDGAQFQQDFARFQRLRDGQYGDLCFFRVRFGQYLVGCGAATDRGDASGMRGLHVVHVVVDHQHRYATIAQYAGQFAADAPVADHQCVVVQCQ